MGFDFLLRVGDRGNESIRFELHHVYANYNWKTRKENKLRGNIFYAPPKSSLTRVYLTNLFLPIPIVKKFIKRITNRIINNTSIVSISIHLLDCFSYRISFSQSSKRTWKTRSIIRHFNAMHLRRRDTNCRGGDEKKSWQTFSPLFHELNRKLHAYAMKGDTLQAVRI